MNQPERIIFQETVWDYYAKHSRHDLPWRQAEPGSSFNPYKIMVSELMLQQTQVSRVVPKYQTFLAAFPNVNSLAEASLGAVLREWQGLGYNRRAKFLWQAAGMIVKQASFPSTLEGLIALPGIGKNTAGAIMAYTWNKPVIFIETNIRTVYIHHFFGDQLEVSDAAILAAVDQTIDREQPREFYWALMDYGSYLKITVGNLNKVSKQYVKQSQFHGSRRQIRGQIIRLLGDGPRTMRQLTEAITDERLLEVLTTLLDEELIREKQGTYSLE